MLFIMKNITGKELPFNIQLYKSKELVAKYISSLEPAVMLSDKDIVIDPKKRAVYVMASNFL
jgi:hypothetical protein